MSSTELTVRPYRAQDRNPVRGLLSRVFGDSLGFDRFETGNPLGDAIRVVGELNGQVVGFNQWNPWHIPTRGTPILVYQSGASAVDTSARGLGLFAKLLAAGEAAAHDRGVDFFFGFPNPASLNSFQRASWTVIAFMPLRVLVFPAIGKPSPSLKDEIRIDSEFFRWRYERATVENVTIRKPGANRVVFFRRAKALGFSVIKLIDVLTDAGARPPHALASVGHVLPRLKPVVFRASENTRDSGTAAITIPRSWRTPVIMKRIRGHSKEESILRTASYFYGDVDAA